MQVSESDLACVRKWAGSTTDAILDPSSRIFRVSEAEGLIGYRQENGCAIVYGDPACPPDQTESLIKAFHDHCAKENLRVIYLVIGETFARWLFNHGYCKTMIEYGEELIIDPHDDPRKKEGVRACLVRRKVRHALHEDVSVKEYTTFDPRIEEGINEAGERWLKARKGPQIHFSHVRSFEHREGKRWFYAEKNGRIVGVVILSRLERHQGWLMNHLMFVPDAPHGVPELLVVTALEALSKEGCRYVTFGTVPATQLGEIQGLGGLSRYFSRRVYSLANTIYHLNGKKKFWEKFDPASTKAFLSFKDSHIGLKEVVALKKGLNATLISSS
ncbi:DUF2156 domain-containing protein [Estrella lausannensis]|uniref:Phosphatidylglycerol lysyltransferase C-terminal domain-containing protein n=1 Tax=Estrella lausannensis TaxID=483423 RepID=A0A0H5DPQ8_9BACT|nr:DUF2156 domain-containing protein [Estrella lausannensis]CRX38452.1 conserved hypothetical protein [Estrella lausannensis]